MAELRRSIAVAWRRFASEEKESRERGATAASFSGVATGVDGAGRQSGSLPVSIRRSAYFLSSFWRVCDLG
jgi:hypothetical protein